MTDKEYKQKVANAKKIVTQMINAGKEKDIPVEVNAKITSDGVPKLAEKLVINEVSRLGCFIPMK